MAFTLCNGLFIPSESGVEPLLSVMGLNFISLAFTFKFGPTKLSSQTPTIHFSPKPVVIAVRRDRKEDSDVEYKSLRKLVESRCSSLFTEFRPLWYLFKYVFLHCRLCWQEIDFFFSFLGSGHLQTFYCVFGDFSKSDQMWYERSVFLKRLLPSR